MSLTRHSSFDRLRAFAREQSIDWPNWYYTAPFILWVLFVAWASLTPPSNLLIFHFPGTDKQEHGLSYAILGILFLRAWTREDRPGLRAVLSVWALCLLWGGYLEVMQAFTPQRTPDWRDAMADGYGAAAGEFLWLLALAVRARWGPPPIEDPPPADTDTP